MTFASAPDLALGERVVVALPDRSLLLAAVLAHGVPLAGLLVGAVVGFASTGGDLGAVLGAVAGVALALLATPALRAKLEVRLLRRVELRAANAHSRSL